MPSNYISAIINTNEIIIIETNCYAIFENNLFMNVFFFNIYKKKKNNIPLSKNK